MSTNNIELDHFFEVDGREFIVKIGVGDGAPRLIRVIEFDLLVVEFPLMELWNIDAPDSRRLLDHVVANVVAAMPAKPSDDDLARFADALRTWISEQRALLSVSPHD